MSFAKPVLLYDGHCAFCQKQSQRLVRLSGNRLERESFHDPGTLARYPQVTREACEEAMQLILPDGNIYAGAQAAALALQQNPWLRWAGRLYNVPPIGALSNHLYQWIARNRFQFGGTCKDAACAPATPVSSDGKGRYTLISRTFTALLGFIHVMAFGSLAVQIRLLIGSHGLLPLNDFLSQGKPMGVSLLRFPTIFWWGAPDPLLVAGCLLGMALGLALTAQSFWAPRRNGIRMALLAALGLLYLSYITACREFLSFQWDSLLIESTFLAFFLSTDTPDVAVLFLFRWLLFRLYFESGLSKIGSQSVGWRDFSAMITYYETAPLPTWIGWYVHQLPMAIHRFCTGMTLAIELITPFFIFGSRRFRRLAFLLFSYFQIIILLTANYGFFNYLALSLGLFLLDDHDLAKITPWKTKRSEEKIPAKKRSLRILACVIVAMTLVDFGNSMRVASRTTQKALWELSNIWAPYHIANVYRLFGTMTLKRYEVEIQGTLDGKTWLPYEWHYKPGDVTRRPEMTGLHQPRVDFLAWFLTLGAGASSRLYFAQLLQTLCSDPMRAAPLFERLPFGAEPPQALRIVFYQYHFSDWKTRRLTGAWWSREWVGATREIISCKADASSIQPVQQ